MSEILPNNLIDFLDQGEGISVEFKESNKHLPSTLFETICAMLNRSGGHIFLGIKDNGNVIGIEKECVKQMKKDFANLCNNPEKIFPTVHLEMKEYDYLNKRLLYVFVHESSDVHKTANKIFDRNEDGDYDITNNTNMISNLYIRKRNSYIENKIYPFATIDDLRVDLIEKARIMALNRMTNHPWGEMTNEELLKSAGLYDRNIETGNYGFNLACILIFGKDETIKSALSYYKTDAILRIEDLDRYDDRDDIRTNLIDAYKRLVNFVSKHLNDKFYLEDDIRVSVRDKIARELCSNLLVHREYSNPTPARLIITEDEMITENASKPRTIGFIDVNNYSPYPKNPKIAAFFKEIGLVEELGSGIKKMTKYTKIYSGKKPLFKDDDTFMAIIPLKNAVRGVKYLTNIEICEMIYNYVKESDGVSRKEINNLIYPKIIGDNIFKSNKVRTCMKRLVRNGKIMNKGTYKRSNWIANND